MKRNSLTTWKYIGLTVASEIIAYFWYKMSFFRSLQYQTEGTSNQVLIVLLFHFLLFNVLLTLSWRRDGISIISSSIIPLGAFTYAAYKSIGILPAKILFFLLFITLAASIWGIISSVKKRGITEERNAVLKCIYLILRRLAVAFTCFVLVSTFLSINRNPRWLRFGMDYIDSDYGRAFRYADFREERLHWLHKDAWLYLTFDQRFDVLSRLCDVESPQNTRVYFNVLKLDSSEQIRYNPSIHTIEMNTTVLENEDPTLSLRLLCEELQFIKITQRLSLHDESRLRPVDKSLYAEVEAYAQKYGELSAQDFEDDIKEYRRLRLGLDD